MTRRRSDLGVKIDLKTKSGVSIDELKSRPGSLYQGEVKVMGHGQKGHAWDKSLNMANLMSRLGSLHIEELKSRPGSLYTDELEIRAFR